MEVESVLFSQLTHQNCKVLQQVREGNKIIIAKYFGRDSVVLLPVQEYRRLKDLDKEEVTK